MKDSETRGESRRLGWRPRVTWAAKEPRTLSCPVCRKREAQDALLDLEVRPKSRWRLFRCPGCGSLWFPDGEAGDYESEWINPSFEAFRQRYAAELGAAVDVILRGLQPFAGAQVRRYLEIGPGFGFTLDYVGRECGWEAVGVDPSLEAGSGAQRLGWRLVPEYLRSGLDLPGGTFDLVFASEVIEHVADPHRFLEDIVPSVSEDGWLLLTTPDAAAIVPEASEPRLAGLLAPGWHLVLFNRESLAALLAEHGLEHCQIWSEGDDLIVAASRQSKPALPDPVLDRSSYCRYLEGRRGQLKDDPWLATGFNYRLFKELVNAGAYRDARQVLTDLSAAYRRHFGLDFENPATLNPAFPLPEDPAALSGLTPMNLPNAAYFGGLLAYLGEADSVRAEAYFRLAVRGLLGLHRLLDAVSLVNSEIGDLLERTPENIALVCQAGAAEGVFEALSAVEACGRDLALARRRALRVLVDRGHFAAADALSAGKGSKTWSEAYPGLRRRDAALERFIAAVNGGDLRTAIELRSSLPGEPKGGRAGGFLDVLDFYYRGILLVLAGRPDESYFQEAAAAAAELQEALCQHDIESAWPSDYYAAARVQQILVRKAAGRLRDADIGSFLAEGRRAFGEEIEELLQAKLSSMAARDSN